MAEYTPMIKKLNDLVTLKRKGDLWKPNQTTRATIESCGYIFGELIDEGEGSKIRKAYAHKMNKTVAVKIIKKQYLSENALKKCVPREITLLQRLNHPALPDLYEVYESDKCLYMIMEYIPNGTLLDFINKMGNLTEIDARRIFHQLLDVVDFLHRGSIVHRDIKCDNIMLDDHYNIKLIDFGFSRYMPQNQILETACGSYVYAAPEVLAGDQYDGVQADIWSIDCRDLLRKMLSFDPKLRPSILDIRQSKWMCKPLKSVGESSMSSMSVAAVMSENRLPENFDPNAEHGFTCEQSEKPFKTSRVTDVLRSVAENHSTGQSSVKITEIPELAAKTSATAMVTGVSGPVGRKISQQLGLDTGLSGEGESKGKSLSMWGSKNTGGSGKGKEAFGKAFKALRKFKVVAKTVTATRRFRRGPLTTILKISQEEAMEKTLQKRSEDNQHDKKHLHYTKSSQVLACCVQEKVQDIEKKIKESEIEEYPHLTKTENRKELKSTVDHLLPKAYR
ncbi:hypothetical protein KUTeg_003041 [Tegillarca granosa]|uniref:Protein kinase domain-containing protein n=1 Tax=Tegillarca granosa TaxID=220873 RepID=A0ABQ9FNX2_TEGGR|nr:hypothetical protein KUTeg_003041 [Tegillarca granosa]